MAYTGKRDRTLDDYARRVVWDPDFKEALTEYRAKRWRLQSVRTTVFQIVRRILEEQEKERGEE